MTYYFFMRFSTVVNFTLCGYTYVRRYLLPAAYNNNNNGNNYTFCGGTRFASIRRVRALIPHPAHAELLRLLLYSCRDADLYMYGDRSVRLRIPRSSRVRVGPDKKKKSRPPNAAITTTAAYDCSSSRR